MGSRCAQSSRDIGHPFSIGTTGPVSQPSYRGYGGCSSHRSTSNYSSMPSTSNLCPHLTRGEKPSLDIGEGTCWLGHYVHSGYGRRGSCGCRWMFCHLILERCVVVYGFFEISLFTFGILLLATHLHDTVRFEVAVSGLRRICCSVRHFTSLVVVSAIHVNLGNVRASSFQANN